MNGWPSTTRYTVRAIRNGPWWTWGVPVLSGRSLLFVTGRGERALIYALQRATGCSHREAVAMTRKLTKDLRQK